VANGVGETEVQLQLAIEYPSIYHYEQNWFATRISVRATQELSIEVPQYINNVHKQTHQYLLPPHSYNKLQTNRDAHLKLGYSMQSVYDYASGDYQYKESATPIIALENDQGIRTFDKVGKVTVIIEENQAFSDQVVMLNVQVAHVFTLSVTEAYSTLTFPMASTIQLPIKFQNEKAHSFADRIEGISVGVELSHPRVVKAKLDEFNSTLILEAQGSGECNVVVYLNERPEVFDVIKVRVTSVVSPPSPITLHVGGEVLFQVIDEEQTWSAEQAAFKPTWSSSQPSTLGIHHSSGSA